MFIYDRSKTIQLQICNVIYYNFIWRASTIYYTLVSNQDRHLMSQIIFKHKNVSICLLPSFEDHEGVGPSVEADKWANQNVQKLAHAPVSNETDRRYNMSGSFPNW